MFVSPAFVFVSLYVYRFLRFVFVSVYLCVECTYKDQSKIPKEYEKKLTYINKSSK